MKDLRSKQLSESVLLGQEEQKVCKAESDYSNSIESQGFLESLSKQNYRCLGEWEFLTDSADWSMR